MSTTMNTEAQEIYTGPGHAVVVPIDWESITAPARVGVVNALQVRQILNELVESCNKIFSIVMDGPLMNKIAVKRQRRDGCGQKTVYLTIWRCQSLFGNHKVDLRWKESGQSRHLFMSVLSIWFKSSQRRTEYHTRNQHVDDSQSRDGPFQPPNPVLKWLERILGHPEEASPVAFGAFNARKRIIEDVHSSIQASGSSIVEWNAKKVWQEYYRLLPGTRPAKGFRTRRKGQDVVYVPRHDDIKARLDDIRAKARGRFRF